MLLKHFYAYGVYNLLFIDLSLNKRQNFSFILSCELNFKSAGSNFSDLLGIKISYGIIFARVSCRSSNSYVFIVSIFIIKALSTRIFKVDLSID